MKWWRTQDWFWSMAFLVYALGFGFAYREMFMDFISYVSTFVSFALGAVAIFISVREATKTDAVKDEIYAALGELRERTSQMDNKLSKFDPTVFNEKKDLEIDKITSQVKQEITESLSKEKGLSLSNVNELVAKKISEATKELKESLHYQDQAPLVQELRKYQYQINKLEKIILIFFRESGKVVDQDKTWRYITENHGLQISKHQFTTAYVGAVTSFKNIDARMIEGGY
ncbi:hypothetical protein [Paenibacillus sp. FJAT-26967]|uniref:hypothetical protein n=1 Tax=Paenibacillus sp. FJAT-26967 TaxID=1729690 RepID=UPI0008387E70|nr:hypothetical protein [Paenibacillus sp. FJAT-26967]